MVKNSARKRRPLKENPRRRFIPNSFTIFNMFLGFMSILSSTNGDYFWAAWFIIFGAIFDGFDGKIARALDSTSDFGIQFDSLADIITFCLAPSVFVYMVWAEPLGQLVGGFYAFMPLMLGSIRLAKFNLEAEGDQKNQFYGVPTPLMALTVVGIWLFMSQINQYPFLGWEPHNAGGDARIVLPLVMIISSLMLSKIPFSKSPRMDLKGSTKEKWSLISGVVMVALVIVTKGFLMFPLAVLLILSSLLKWTRSQREIEDEPVIK
ncbi:MAG: phosphatidylcholine/phosphatidylserine synthase [Candidatus Marinimicrobia bacterium]|jgi:CDP-diacylglycerol--serine O-phosphatidyltransferase|nr:phosphatidylcholine/phosphatidylserine synthase [Candidatus Neomarinimicrobiota bacterium]MBT3630839.1 phosphatidylcholine/phosphatidylserine synthase [Candidatus Neomarinimicrobiota bacterium]MBT3825213.1 phosphatidylcholine/phosphatidylserine synthase [Candidatus Neomarinimicrobiota bacterium]MBT4132555.1 phosphatidylcholine/phosphatidylserine synthase [Candidatus Neomarinimicrobiota bacterium]MBT4296436.1 phosphatidylcholine/phosphatidylserine synthase [Candidatus Neomarinimicrobiota bact